MPDPSPASSASSSQLQIGWVEKLDGNATVRHANGTTSPLHKGDIVFQGDKIHTDGGSKIGLVFLDHSTFALGANGEMVLDEMIFDPNAPMAGAKSVTSVVTGAFALSSGQIAHDHPGSQEIRTPTLTIGIRGTTVAGEVAPDGSLVVALLRDSDGTVGEIELLGIDGSVATISAPGIGLSHYTGGAMTPGPVDVQVLTILAGTLPSGMSQPPAGLQPVSPSPLPEQQHLNDNTNTNTHGEATPSSSGGTTPIIALTLVQQIAQDVIAADTGGAPQTHIYAIAETVPSVTGTTSFSGTIALDPHGSGTVTLQGTSTSNALLLLSDAALATPSWTISGNGGHLTLSSNVGSFVVTALNIQTFTFADKNLSVTVGQDGSNVTLSATTNSDTSVVLGSGVGRAL